VLSFLTALHCITRSGCQCARVCSWAIPLYQTPSRNHWVALGVHGTADPSVEPKKEGVLAGVVHTNQNGVHFGPARHTFVINLPTKVLPRSSGVFYPCRTCCPHRPASRHRTSPTLTILCTVNCNAGCRRGAGKVSHITDLPYLVGDGTSR
jgi:hypothetical protein